MGVNLDINANKDLQRETRLQLGRILDAHCKPCTLIKGVHFDKRKAVCDKCEIGQQLQRIGKPLYLESAARKLFPGQVNVEIKKETIEMNKRLKNPPGGLTKEIYLKEKAAGKGNAKIEREYGMSVNSLYYWLHKWELVELPSDPSGVNAATESLPSSDTADLVVANQLDLSRFKDVEIEQLRKELGFAKFNEDRVLEISRQAAERKDIEIERLKNELAQASTVAPAPDDKLAAILNYVQLMAGVDPRSAIFESISIERRRQDSLHPVFEHRMEILVEEVGEVAKAKLEGKQTDMRKELIEVASVAVRWIEALDCESV